MHKLKLAPQITRVLSPQKFYGLNSRTAYTLCGSFIRHIYDVYGAQHVWNAYRNGEFGDGSDNGLKPMLQDWRTRLAAIKVPEAALAEARNKFDRPSIFGRVCAREIASLWRTYRRQKSLGKYDATLKTLEQILGHLPQNPTARLALIDVFTQLNKTVRAREIAAELTDDKDAGGVARDYARERLVDLNVQMGTIDNAAEKYKQIAETVFSRPRLRELAVKKAVLEFPRAAAPLMRYLRGQLKPKARLAALRKIEKLTGPWPVIDYLKARVNLALGKKQESADLFATASRTLKSNHLIYESLLQLARLLFSAECYDLASQSYEHLAKNAMLVSLPGERSELQEWSRRSDFFDTEAATKKTLCPIDIDMNVFDAEYAGETGF